MSHLPRYRAISALCLPIVVAAASCAAPVIRGPLPALPAPAAQVQAEHIIDPLLYGVTRSELEAEMREAQGQRAAVLAWIATTHFPDVDLPFAWRGLQTGLRDQLAVSAERALAAALPKSQARDQDAVGEGGTPVLALRLEVVAVQDDAVGDPAVGRMTGDVGFVRHVPRRSRVSAVFRVASFGPDGTLWFDELVRARAETRYTLIEEGWVDFVPRRERSVAERRGNRFRDWERDDECPEFFTPSGNRAGHTPGFCRVERNRERVELRPEDEVYKSVPMALQARLDGHLLQSLGELLVAGDAPALKCFRAGAPPGCSLGAAGE